MLLAKLKWSSTKRKHLLTKLTKATISAPTETTLSVLRNWGRSLKRRKMISLRKLNCNSCSLISNLKFLTLSKIRRWKIESSNLQNSNCRLTSIAQASYTFTLETLRLKLTESFKRVFSHLFYKVVSSGFLYSEMTSKLSTVIRRCWVRRAPSASTCCTLLLCPKSR